MILSVNGMAVTVEADAPAEFAAARGHLHRRHQHRERRGRQHAEAEQHRETGDQQRGPDAEASLHRAIAQGAGADAWEELGHGLAAHGDDALARQCYANALRAARGEDVAWITAPQDDLAAPVLRQA